MKKIVKQFLNKSGILHYIKKQRRQQFFKKYKQVNEWKFPIEDLDVSFDTTDLHSKKWFYPRYDNCKVHEPIATKIFMEYLMASSQVLDIGGHIGYFSCIAGKIVTKGQVYVFEMDFKACELIRKNIERNDLNNVKVLNVAVTDKNQIIKIPKLSSLKAGLSIDTNLKKNFILVKSICIDDFVREYNLQPDFIKIDVEGAEGLVLKGMKSLLKRANLRILVEVHVDKLRNQFDTNYTEIIELLIENNFSVMDINHRIENSKFRLVNKNTALSGNTMLWCVKST